MDWARAYGLIRDPGTEPQMISLIGPGPGFDSRYAMTTNLDDPVIIATLTTVGGKPAGPLLIDGYALPSLSAANARASSERVQQAKATALPACKVSRMSARWACVCSAFRPGRALQGVPSGDTR
jgi:hypothetical protein